MWTFCLNILILSISHASFAADDAQNTFYSPATEFPQVGFGADPVWALGSNQVVSWTSQNDTYNISYWQQDPVQASAILLSPPLAMFDGNGAGNQSFNWQVALQGADLSFSSIFILVVRSNGVDLMSSAYFNITDQPVASTPTSVVFEPPATSSTASSSSPTTSTASSMTSTSASGTSMTSTLSTSNPTSASSSSTPGNSTTAPLNPGSTQNSTSTSNSSKSLLKMGLGLGLGIGIPLLILLGAVAAFLALRKRPAAPQTNSYDHDYSRPSGPLPFDPKAQPMATMAEYNPFTYSELPDKYRGPYEVPAYADPVELPERMGH